MGALYTEGKISWKEFFFSIIWTKFFGDHSFTDKYGKMEAGNLEQFLTSQPEHYVSEQSKPTSITSTLTFSPMRFQVLEKSPLTLPKQQTRKKNYHFLISKYILQSA